MVSILNPGKYSSGCYLYKLPNLHLVFHSQICKMIILQTNFRKHFKKIQEMRIHLTEFLTSVGCMFFFKSFVRVKSTLMSAAESVLTEQISGRAGGMFHAFVLLTVSPSSVQRSAPRTIGQGRTQLHNTCCVLHGHCVCIYLLL